MNSNPFAQEIAIIEQELLNRKLNTSYYDYVQYANPEYTPTRLHEYLCNSVQNFIEKKNPAHSFDVLLISLPPQHGKGYPVDTPILTTTGWKKHGDLKRGDYVYNHLGEQVMVTHTQTPYMHPCMEVTFHTGERHIVTREHLWLINNDFVFETQRLKIGMVIKSGLVLKDNHTIIKDKLGYLRSVGLGDDIIITAVERVEDHLVSCISVVGGMYLAGEGLIPTHNSLSITETLPSWYLGKNPSHDVIIVSYNEDTAQRFGRRNKEKLELYGGNLFPKYIPKDSPWSNTEFESTKKGRCLSRGIFSGVTGNPAHLFIIDDPVKNRQEADSPTTRKAIMNEYWSTFKSRIKPNGRLIVIQTRWHEEDLFGTLEQVIAPNRLTVINLPAEADSDNDPLGRQIGEALAPEIGRGNAWLKEFKEEYVGKEGRRAWFALYQGKPTREDGNIIKSEFFKYYDTPPEQVSYKLISVDAAFKAGDDNDYVAIQVWGKIDNNYYLLDQVREHLTFKQTLTSIREMRVRHPDTLVVLIEDKANGSAIINVLSDEMDGIIPVEPSGGKVSRAHAISPVIESGQVFIPRHASWTGEFLTECSAFPNTSHDDQVDSMTQALHHMIYVEAPNKNETVYTKWSDDMWEDYYNANELLQNELLSMWGYPEEWRD